MADFAHGEYTTIWYQVPWSDGLCSRSAPVVTGPDEYPGGRVYLTVMLSEEEDDHA